MKNKSTIAIIDEDVLFSGNLKHKFNNEGFKTYVYNNYEGISESLKSINPSLIICNVNLADGIGYDSINDLRSNKFYNLTPIIVLTNINLDDEQIDEILLLGVSGLFFKPLKFDKFLKSIIQILNKRKSHEVIESSLEFIFYPFKIFSSFIYWLIFRKSY
jgi:two-component system sensor histidine kinase/response regulator